MDLTSIKSKTIKMKQMQKMEQIREKHFVLFVLFLCLATTINSTTESKGGGNNKHHFVLVHGYGHGAWCWYKVATLLKYSGHNVTALDLAASGINPKQIQQIHSLADYSEPFIKFMASLPKEEKVVLVGHSMGGPVISIAMETFPERISAAVFATALMPGPTLSFNTTFQKITSRLPSLDSQYRYDRGPNNPPTSYLFGPKLLASHLYQLSPSEDLTLGLSLVRFAPLFYEEIKLTKEKYGKVPRAFIVCDQDQAIPEDLQWWMIKENPPNEVKIINGSDHMVMFSRPLELFFHLQNIADKYS